MTLQLRQYVCVPFNAGARYVSKIDGDNIFIKGFEDDGTNTYKESDLIPCSSVETDFGNALVVDKNCTNPAFREPEFCELD